MKVLEYDGGDVLANKWCDRNINDIDTVWEGYCVWIQGHQRGATELLPLSAAILDRRADV